MNLQFFLSDKLIETVPIDDASMSNPLYLPGIKAQLQEKYKDVIEASTTAPSFYVQAASSVSDRRTSIDNTFLARKN